MINHLRTLLFGQSHFDPDLPGHVMIDPGFVPAARIGELEKADIALFGNHADNFARNYWLSHFMRLLHAPDHEAAVLAYDPRVTYLPLTDDLFDLYAGPNPVALGGTPVFFVGEHTDDVEGRMYRRWDAIATALDTLQLNNGTSQTSTALTWSAGLSQPVTLPGSTLQIRLGGSSLASGTQFRIESYRRPEFGLSDIPNRILTYLSPDEIFRIFEPSPSLFDTWLGTDQLAARLCAFLKALAVRLEAGRGGT